VPSKGNTVEVDHSGQKESGDASIYSTSFDGKEMANGQHYSPHGDAVASKSLPLGTVAKVTNLENCKSTEVQVKDRGPFVSGRVLDVSPTTAGKLGLTENEGVGPVVVAPIRCRNPTAA
jgi:rare lipoprotein A